MGDDANLDVFRLMYDLDALEGERDFVEYADTANTRGFIAEAKAALDAGNRAGDVNMTKPYVAELSGLVNDRIGNDKAELAGLAKEAAGEANGKLAASTATAYLGHGDNAEAVRLYRLALDKGGVDADQVNTRLGIALTRMNDYDAARAAFANVSGGKAKVLADYWTAYVDHEAGAGSSTSAMVETNG